MIRRFFIGVLGTAWVIAPYFVVVAIIYGAVSIIIAHGWLGVLIIFGALSLIGGVLMAVLGPKHST